jgi:hypothetical protein
MNYVLEGKENFNDRLLTALCNTETNDTKQKCLISNNNLENNAITLNCKHTFNYSPLIKEITKQKSVANRLEIQRLKKFQIKCPYCRQIHNHILPYRALDKQIFGVNWPPKYALQPHRCQAILKSGKRKGVSKNFVTNTSHVLSLQYQRMNIAQPSLKMEKIKGNSAHIKAKRVDGVGYTNFKNI